MGVTNHLHLLTGMILLQELTHEYPLLQSSKPLRVDDLEIFPQVSSGKKTRMWHSIESWLVNRDPYNGFMK